MNVDNGTNPYDGGFVSSGGMSLQQQQQQQQQQQTPFPQPPPPPFGSNTIPPFGMLVPGLPVRTDFVPVDGSGTKLALQLNYPGDLPNPLLVNELVFFFLGATTTSTAIANGIVGVMIYWQLTSGNEQSGFELLGTMTIGQPSQIFRTGWSEHDQFLSLSPNQPITVTIGLSLEPIESIRNIVTNTTSSNVNARRPLVAQKIAQDLYNFMQSFDTGSGNSGGMMKNGTMVVPTNIFERWWKRFEMKSQRDPSFFLKNSV